MSARPGSVEGQQGVAVLCQAGDGLGVFGVVRKYSSPSRPRRGHPPSRQGSFGGRLSRLRAGAGPSRLPEAQSAIADQACQQLTHRSRAGRVPCVPPAWRREDQNACFSEDGCHRPTWTTRRADRSRRRQRSCSASTPPSGGRSPAPTSRGVLAEQRLQRLLEVPAGHATKVERRQNRIQRPRPPRETGQNGRRDGCALLRR